MFDEQPIFSVEVLDASTKQPLETSVEGDPERTFAHGKVFGNNSMNTLIK